MGPTDPKTHRPTDPQRHPPRAPPVQNGWSLHTPLQCSAYKVHPIIRHTVEPHHPHTHARLDQAGPRKLGATPPSCWACVRILWLVARRRAAHVYGHGWARVHTCASGLRWCSSAAAHQLAHAQGQAHLHGDMVANIRMALIHRDYPRLGTSKLPQFLSPVRASESNVVNSASHSIQLVVDGDSEQQGTRTGSGWRARLLDKHDGSQKSEASELNGLGYNREYHKYHNHHRKYHQNTTVRYQARFVAGLCDCRKHMFSGHGIAHPCSSNTVRCESVPAVAHSDADADGDAETEIEIPTLSGSELQYHLWILGRERSLVLPDLWQRDPYLVQLCIWLVSDREI
jgi:hypothetical protein